MPLTWPQIVLLDNGLGADVKLILLAALLCPPGTPVEPMVAGMLGYLDKSQRETLAWILQRLVRHGWVVESGRVCSPVVVGPVLGEGTEPGTDPAAA